MNLSGAQTEQGLGGPSDRTPAWREGSVLRDENHGKTAFGKDDRSVWQDERHLGCKAKINKNNNINRVDVMFYAVLVAAKEAGCFTAL
ncbi:MAG: hypothetical protein QM776_08080 [Rhodocyclaceae bacterium]